jgi:hypothetical protein
VKEESMRKQHPAGHRHRLTEGRDFEPCMILPEQFFEGATVVTGEQKLLMAMLEDVVRIYGRAVSLHATARVRLDARAARAWVDADDPRFPFSFVNVCTALGLDPGAIRRELRRAAWGVVSIADSAPPRRVVYE